MTKISREEVLAIAHISNLEVRSHEIEGVIKQLEDVLTYAERVQELAGQVSDPLEKNQNIFRKDIPGTSDAQLLLEQAPEVEGRYFTVPIILETSTHKSDIGDVL